jgi:hypothetical protein
MSTMQFISGISHDVQGTALSGGETDMTIVLSFFGTLMVSCLPWHFLFGILLVSSGFERCNQLGFAWVLQILAHSFTGSPCILFSLSMQVVRIENAVCIPLPRPRMTTLRRKKVKGEVGEQGELQEDEELEEEELDEGELDEGELDEAADDVARVKSCSQVHV